MKGWPVNGGYKCELHTKKTRPFYFLLLHLNRLLRLHPLLPCKTNSGLSHSPLHLSRLLSKKPERSKVGKSEEAPRPHHTTASSSRESLAWWCWWLAGAEPKSKSKYNKGEIVRRLSWAQCKCCTPLGKPSLSAPAVGILCLFATLTNVFCLFMASCGRQCLHTKDTSDNGWLYAHNSNIWCFFC